MSISPSCVSHRWQLLNMDEFKESLTIAKAAKKIFCEHASHAIKGRSFRSFFINVWLTQDIPPKVWNFNVYISCLWSMFSRGIISMPWFALPFLFCLLNVFSNNSVRKKWKLRCKYCILKWRVWKLHIHARVVNIFGSGLKKHYPVLSDLPIFLFWKMQYFRHR